VLDDWNGTKTAWPAESCVHRLFEAQAARTPDAVAVVWRGEEMSYQTLASRAAGLAAVLREHGVGPEVRVAVWLERSVDLVIALAAVLEAGGAYVPLDPAYPATRVAWMLDDAEVSVIVTDTRLRDRLPSSSAAMIDVAARSPSPETPSPEPRESPDQLAYVMYTSGSTGTPKGVMVPHRAITRLVLETNYVSLGPGSRIAQGSNASFDAATFEIWGALLTGGTLVGIERETLLAPHALAAALKAEDINVLWLTASVFGEVAREIPAAFRDLEYVLFGGEAVEPRWVELVQQAGPPRHLLNGYGPTEGTTFSLCHEVTQSVQSGGPVPVGRPIANTRAYILDAQGQPVPIGVAGEIHVGGAGLARGYWRRAGQTIWDATGPTARSSSSAAPIRRSSCAATASSSERSRRPCAHIPPWTRRRWFSERPPRVTGA
jgi:amino acid adenylation domain-containing protein